MRRPSQSRLGLSLLALSLACGFARPPAANDETGSDSAETGTPSATVRVATFNVRKFFDKICQTGQCGPSDFEEVLDSATFNARVAEIAAAIEALDADIVLLQEVENQYCVDQLMGALSPRFVGAVIGEKGFDGSLDVATITAFPIDEIVLHDKGPIPLPTGGTTFFSRELLEVRVTAEGTQISVFNAHFKSKVSDDPARRLAEAIQTESVVRGRAAAIPDGLVILGGDLNDTPGSDPLLTLEASGTLSRVAQELANSATVVFDGRGEAIDHLYVSTAATGGRFLSGTAQVFTDPPNGFGGSDHASLAADFGVGYP